MEVFMIKIDFEFETQYGTFRDALHLPDDHGFSEEEITSLKQQRLDNWLSVVNAPPALESEQEVVVQNDIVEIAGERYAKLEDVPPSGAKLVEVAGVWYYKV